MRFGDWALLEDKKGRRYLIRLKEGGRFSHHRGAVDHAEIVAAGSGGVVHTHQGEPLFVYRPTLEEYVLLMQRGATVTYPKDAAAMVMMLDLAPGMRVLEAGTGSGGLALFLSRAVGETGEVHSYELRPAFQKRAGENIRAWGATNVRLFAGDLAEAELPKAHYDAVALDMMEPWKVLEKVAWALKPGRPAVLYLPNITQVIEVLETAREKGLPFRKKRVQEVIHREWDVRPPIAHPAFRQVGHTAFLLELRRIRKPEAEDQPDPEHEGGQPEEEDEAGPGGEQAAE